MQVAKVSMNNYKFNKIGSTNKIKQQEFTTLSINKTHPNFKGEEQIAIPIMGCAATIAAGTAFMLAPITTAICTLITGTVVAGYKIFTDLSKKDTNLDENIYD